MPVAAVVRRSVRVEMRPEGCKAVGGTGLRPAVDVKCKLMQGETQSISYQVCLWSGFSLLITRVNCLEIEEAQFVHFSTMMEH